MIGSQPELVEQLIVEISVSNLDRLLALYTTLGFAKIDVTVDSRYCAGKSGACFWMRCQIY